MYKSSVGNVYKWHQVTLHNDDAMMIDNDEKVAEKIEYIKEQLLKDVQPEGDGEEEALDGFLGGLDAEQVEALTADDGGEEKPTVIKAEKPESEESAEALSVVSAQAQEVLASARREAENIKSQALAEATREMEELRRTTLEEAEKNGYDEGYHKGMEQIEKQKAQLAEERKRMEEEYQQQIDELEPRFVETLTDIYEKVFQVDLKKEHDIIVHLISTTMHKLEGNSSYLIHVSKEDYQYVNLKKNEVLVSAISANATVEIVEDMTLGPNDCIIETDTGVFDCGLGTQLEELSQKLKLLSYSRK